MIDIDTEKKTDWSNIISDNKEKKELFIKSGFASINIDPDYKQEIMIQQKLDVKLVL